MLRATDRLFTSILLSVRRAVIAEVKDHDLIEGLSTALHEMILHGAQAAGERNQYSAPHCDMRVLHAPRECEFCDKFPERQDFRIANLIEFTGHPIRPSRALAGGMFDEWTPCPADFARGTAGAHVWGGNTPKPAEPQPSRGWVHRERGTAYEAGRKVD